MSEQPQGPGWWLASDGRWYAPAFRPQPPDEPTYVRWNDPRPWALGTVLAGWFGLFAILYMTGVETNASGNTDGCAREIDLSDYRQCARGEETFILNFHSVVVVLGTFGLIIAVRGIRHRGFDRELQRPSGLIAAAVLAVLLLATTVLWRVLGSSGIAEHERPFEPIPTSEVIVRIGLGVVIGCLLELVPLRQRPKTSSD